MEVQEPALAFLRAIEGRIPLDRLAHPGNGLLDELVEATTDGVLPPRHRRDIGLDRCVALALRDLRIAAGEQHHLLAAPKGRSEEHTSELQSLMRISYAVFC